MTTPETLPPPLSDAPSVETLERLLVGLHTPMQRGVPSPPATDRGPATAIEPPPASVDAAAREVPPPLSWSAGNRDRGTRAATALGVAAVAAAAAVAGLAATGQIALP